MNKKILLLLLLLSPSFLFARISKSELQRKTNALCKCVSSLCNAVNKLGDRISVLEIDIAILNEVTGVPIRGCPSTGTYTISAPGLYKLSRDITCCILITTSNVALDLNGHTITGTDCTSVITTEDNLTNIEIMNGTIVGSGANDGITTGQNNTNIIIHDVEMSNFDPGILLQQGTTFSRIYDCLIETASRCIELEPYCDDNIIENCVARDFTAYGIIVTGSRNLVDSCTIGPCDRDLPLNAGIQVNSGDGNTIFNCDVGNIQDPDSFRGIRAGNLPNTTNTTIDQCIVHDITIDTHQPQILEPQ